MTIHRNYLLSLWMFLAILSIPTLSSAQDKKKDGDDIMDMLEENEQSKEDNKYTTATFKGTRCVNFHTIETPGKRTLEFRISHHFGNFGTDNSSPMNYLRSIPQGYFGFDGGASIRMGLEYSLNGRWEIGCGRSSVDKMADLFGKYKILRQTNDGSMPVTMAWMSSINVNTTRDVNHEAFPKAYHRLNFVHQLLIARRFGPNLSLQLSPTYIHYNLVEQSNFSNDMFALVAMGRMKLSPHFALTAEYAYRLNYYQPVVLQQRYYNSVSIGADLETGGHVFQMFFTNSYGILECQTIPYTNGNITKGMFRLGFNISRAFTK